MILHCLEVILKQSKPVILILFMHSHDLRVPVGSLSRFKLSLPQRNVPGLLNSHITSHIKNQHRQHNSAPADAR